MRRSKKARRMERLEQYPVEVLKAALEIIQSQVSQENCSNDERNV